MNTRIITIVALLAIAFATKVAAEHNLIIREINHAEVIVIKGHRIKHEWLFEIRAKTTSLDEFASEIAPVLRAATEQHGFEVCGVFSKNEQGELSVVIGTSNARIACILKWTKVANGTRHVKESIHTHPETTSSRLSRVERSILEVMGGETISSLHSSRTPMITGEGVSEPDLAAGNGYIVMPSGEVIHHRGTRDSIRKI